MTTKDPPTLVPRQRESCVMEQAKIGDVIECSPSRRRRLRNLYRNPSMLPSNRMTVVFETTSREHYAALAKQCLEMGAKRVAAGDHIEQAAGQHKLVDWLARFYGYVRLRSKEHPQ